LAAFFFGGRKMRRDSTWTGSEKNRRRPQGGVAQASRPGNVKIGGTKPQARFTIPEVTTVLIKKDRDADWRDYETKKKLEFERFEFRSDGNYEFRFEGYLIRVRSADLIIRDLAWPR
jgi:hypothetical protein